MCFYVFRSYLYRIKSVYDFTFCCFYVTISWKRNVFYKNGSVHIISFQWGSWKHSLLKIENFNKNEILYPICERGLLNSHRNHKFGYFKCFAGDFVKILTNLPMTCKIQMLKNINQNNFIFFIFFQLFIKAPHQFLNCFIIFSHTFSGACLAQR